MKASPIAPRSAVMLIVASLLILSALLLPARAQPAGAQADVATSGWQVRPLDAPKWFEDMGPRSLALDAAGRPHVAYGSDHLYYAWFDGTFWQYALVDAAPGAGRYAALALDATDTPHFLYYDAARAELKYATRTQTGWRSESVANGLTLDAPAGLAVSSAGAVHAAYRNATTGTVIYARRTAGGWTQEPVDSATGGAVDLALNADTPHLVYGRGTLRYARRDAAGWTLQTVDPAGVLEARSLVLDSGAAPQVAYTGTNGEGRAELRLARLTRSGWSVQVVDTVLPREVGYEPSLRLDKQNYANISYRAYNGLKYARWTGSEWFRQVVDPAEGRDTSLVLDASGVPHITYRRGLEFVYARRPGISWTFRTLDTARTTGTHTAVAVDTNGNAHISYRDMETGSLRYAGQAGQDWALQVVDPAPGLPGYTSLALENNLPRIAYYAYASADTPGKLQYAAWTGSRWDITTSDGDTGPLNTTGAKQPSLRFDGNGQPHVGYYDGSDQTVKVASRTGGAWNAATVTGPTQTGEDVALALDSAGAPHLSFYDAQADALVYAHQTGAGWAFSTVAGGNFAGSFTSLALDAANRPHICFSQTAETTADLRYARWTGANWQIETVETGAPVVGSYCALALAPGDRPHMAYYDDTAADLKYAQRNGSGWSVQTVDAVGEVGRYAALALTAGGAPRIAYADTTARDLKFAALADSAACPATPTPHPPYAGTPAASGTVQRAVAHCMDDAFVIADGTTELRYDSTTIRTGGQAAPAQPYTRYIGGFVFRDIRIPRGAQITSARLRLAPGGLQTGSPVPLQIAGELSAQARDFNPANPWLHERPRTASRVDWTISATVTQAIDSPDLAAILMEIVGQGGWQAGNDLALFLDPIATGNHTVDWQAYELAAAGAAELTVSYVAPTGGPTATPTATPTRAARRLYLPLVMR